MAIRILKLGNHGKGIKLENIDEAEINAAFQKQLQNKSKLKQIILLSVIVMY